MLGRRWPTRRSQCRAHHAERKFLMSVSTRKHTAPAGGKVAAVAVASLFAATALAGSALAQEVKIGLVGGISGPIAALARSAESRVGTDGVSTCISTWSPSH